MRQCSLTLRRERHELDAPSRSKPTSEAALADNGRRGRGNAPAAVIDLAETKPGAV
jgi:hypothetical protein